MRLESVRCEGKRAASSIFPNVAQSWKVILAWGLPGLLALALVTGCGFKLRGQVELPPAMRVTYVKVNRPPGTPPGTLERTLQDFLRANGVEVATDPKQATAILEIVSEDRSNRLVATNREGNTRTWTLTYLVNYRVLLPDNKELLPQTAASVSRNVTYPESAILSRGQGENVAHRDMEYELVRAIFFRLEALGRKA
ncbi:MAG: LPS assembly lipoprotein LptE [Candidatus Competibacteraceae bacterium]